MPGSRKSLLKLVWVRARAICRALFTEQGPGNVIFEVDGLDEVNMSEALRKGGSKLPVKTKTIASSHQIWKIKIKRNNSVGCYG